MIRYIIFVLMLLSTGASATQTKNQPETALDEYQQFMDFTGTNNNPKYIIVNRASQQLIVVENHEVVLSMRVIVGKRYWNTPLAETELTHVITNPYWNVPVSIATRETIPKIKKNYKKYQRLGYRVFYQEKMYDAIYALYLPANEIKIKQLPGKFNALGQVKFRLKNLGNIYMHDTSIKSKFKRKNRKLSHGCIRLEKPLELISAISPIVYEKSMKEQWHILKKPIPVYIVDWVKS